MVQAIRLSRGAHAPEEMTIEDWERLRTDPVFAELRASIELDFARRVAVERTARRMAGEMRAPDNRTPQQRAEAWRQTCDAGSVAGLHPGGRHVPSPEDLGTAHPYREYDPYSAKALRS